MWQVAHDTGRVTHTTWHFLLYRWYYLVSLVCGICFKGCTCGLKQKWINLCANQPKNKCFCCCFFINIFPITIFFHLYAYERKQSYIFKYPNYQKQRRHVCVIGMSKKDEAFLLRDKNPLFCQIGHCSIEINLICFQQGKQ